MRIIPAIDIIDGKCIRLTRGDYSTKKVYNDNPLEVAKLFEDHGIQYLHLVDLDGARERRIVNFRVLEEIASKTSLKIDFGGGIGSEADLEIAFNSGASQITGGSIAVKNRKKFLEWLHIYGPSRIILGADARNERIAVAGWEEESGEQLIPFIENYRKEGIRYVICTDISRDGMLEGPAFDLYQKILQNTRVTNTRITMSGVEDVEEMGIRLIASGGVSSIDELPRLEKLGCEGVILGKAIYENKIGLNTLKEYILKT